MAERRATTVLLPELGSVHLRETREALVVEVALPDGIDLSRLSTRLADGVLEVRLPRVPRRRGPRRDVHADGGD